MEGLRQEMEYLRCQQDALLSEMKRIELGRSDPHPSSSYEREQTKYQHQPSTHPVPAPRKSLREVKVEPPSPIPATRAKRPCAAPGEAACSGCPGTVTGLREQVIDRSPRTAHDALHARSPSPEGHRREPHRQSDSTQHQDYYRYPQHERPRSPCRPRHHSHHRTQSPLSPNSYSRLYKGPTRTIPDFAHPNPREFSRMKIALENILPANATERFKFHHLKLEEALLVADSYSSSMFPFSDTMAALNKLYGQPHQLALQRIAELMDGTNITSGDIKVFRLFALRVRALVGMLEQLGRKGEVELECGSHVSRLLGKLPHDLRSSFRRYIHPLRIPIPICWT